jgi:hypothetical protein
LVVRQAQRAAILLFHKLDHMRDIRLPLRRPSKHAIEYLFHLSSGH